MLRRSYVLLALIGFGLVGCSQSSDDSSDVTSGLGASAADPDEGPPTVEPGKHRKEILVLCRAPSMRPHGDVLGAPGSAPPAPSGESGERPEPGAIDGAHEGHDFGPDRGPRPLPCVSPGKAKHVRWLCAPAPMFREILSKLGGPGGPGAPIGDAPAGAPSRAPEEGPMGDAPPRPADGEGGPVGEGGPEGPDGRPHLPPILCIAAPPMKRPDGPSFGREGGFGLGGPAAEPHGEPGDPGAPFGDAPTEVKGGFDGKPPMIVACRPKRPRGPGPEGEGAPRPGEDGDRPEQTFDIGDGAHAPGAPTPGPTGGPGFGGKLKVLALSCVPLMPPNGPHGGPGGERPGGPDAPPAPR